MDNNKDDELNYMMEKQSLSRSRIGTTSQTSPRRSPHFTLGVCVMEVKMKSFAMQSILGWLKKSGTFDVIPFDEEMILQKDVTEWPKVMCLICFYSHGFPLEKALQYIQLVKPVTLNTLEQQKILRNRADVYKILGAYQIPHPNYIVVDHEAVKNGEAYFEEHYDYIVYNNIRLNKPFIEKPIDADDHNNWIYYAKNTGGGCKRLFRKKNDRSSEHFSNVHNVRRNGVYVYEEFLSTFGADVKVYTVGKMFAHAEARKAPSLDGKVERTADGKELRFPVILTEEEKIIVCNVVDAFQQNVCGFDILRHWSGAYVCDVNGWSFVKGNSKYCMDTANIIRWLFYEKLTERFSSLPHELPGPILGTVDEETLANMSDEIYETEVNPDNEDEELCTVVIIMRHGDRKPKQKLKFETSNELLLQLFEGRNQKKNVKLKSPEELQDLLFRNSQILEQLGGGGSSTGVVRDKDRYVNGVPTFGRISELTALEYHQWLQHVLQQGDGFMGINRKIQLKPTAWRETNDAVNGYTSYTVSSCLVVAKWDGQITAVGKAQAEELGKRFRATLYPGDSIGLLRLHSTFRHDFKIYSSDEGRCQITSAALTKGFLDLEGDLTPILVSLVIRNAKAHSLLDDSAMVDERQKCKCSIEKLLNKNEELLSSFDELMETSEIARVEKSDALVETLSNIANPHELLRKISTKIEEYYKALNAESVKWEGCSITNQYTRDTQEFLKVAKYRWKHFLNGWKRKDGTDDFDTSRVPDISDNIRYDLIHHHTQLGDALDKAYDIFNLVEPLSHFVAPAEYGLGAEDKLKIATPIVYRLLKKIIRDITFFKTIDEEQNTKPIPRNSSSFLYSMDRSVTGSPFQQSPTNAASKTCTGRREGYVEGNMMDQPMGEEAEEKMLIGNPLHRDTTAISSPNVMTPSSPQTPKYDKDKTKVINKSVLWAHQSDLTDEKMKQSKSERLIRGDVDETYDCEDPEEDHEHEEKNPIRLQEEHARALGIRSPWRIVRSRVYVTSASHIQSILNILIYAHQVEPKLVNDPILGNNAQAELEKVNDPHYLSHIVMRVWENKKEDKESPKRFRLEVQFSPGVKDGFRENYSFLKENANAAFNNISRNGKSNEVSSPLNTFQSRRKRFFRDSSAHQIRPSTTDYSKTPPRTSASTEEWRIETAHEGHASNAYTAPFCELSPAMPLTKNCQLEAFEATINRVLQQYKIKYPVSPS